MRFSLYYTLLTDDGISMDVVGEGMTAVDTLAGQQSKDGGLRVAKSFSRCTCNIQFSVPGGVHEYLQKHLYIGKVSVMPVSDCMTMSIFQVDET